MAKAVKNKSRVRAKRKADSVVDFSWAVLAKKCRLIANYRVAAWKGMLAVFFVAGFAAALVWSGASGQVSNTLAQEQIVNQARVSYKSSSGLSFSASSNEVTTSLIDSNNSIPNKPDDLTQQFDGRSELEGTIVQDTTPKFFFVISDSDQNQRVGYQIQVARDKDFTQLDKDFTWEGSLTNPRHVTFEILPQDALVNGSHFWRVRSKDDMEVFSEWAYYGDRNSVDFIVDGGTPGPVCGNNIKEVGEQCDGADLGGQSCQSVGSFTGGALGCNSDCTFNTNQCTSSTPTSGGGSAQGLWTSAEELASKPMNGAAWSAVKSAADSSTANPNVSNQDDSTNVNVLAAAIVYARTGDNSYKAKVVSAIGKLVSKGHPGGRTLAWGREVGAYALAADLAGYRTSAFESWLRNIAETWNGSQIGKPLLGMYKQRPNNWGAMAFGSLTAIYGYLDDQQKLNEIRSYWIDSIDNTPGPSEAKYGSLTWQYRESHPRWINPKGASKNCGGTINIDGIIPDDTRRGGGCKIPPSNSGYVWEGQQGLIMAYRIFERLGMPLWDAQDKALLRTVTAYQVRWASQFSSSWKASGDDLWMLPFYDNAYGTNFSSGAGNGIWGAGKNTGWAYVLP